LVHSLPPAQRDPCAMASAASHNTLHIPDTLANTLCYISGEKEPCRSCEGGCTTSGLRSKQRVLFGGRRRQRAMTNSRGRKSNESFRAFALCAVPELTSRTCQAIVQPRRAAYSRMARFCIASVCWSLVKTRAYSPAGDICSRFRAWPKTLPNLALCEDRLPGVRQIRFAWPLSILFARQDSSYYAAADAANRAKVLR
jgi:hypothetical protein